MMREKSGLVETMGCICSASYSTNFSVPTHNRLPASAERRTTIPTSSSACPASPADLAPMFLAFMKLLFFAIGTPTLLLATRLAAMGLFLIYYFACRDRRTYDEMRS